MSRSHPNKPPSPAQLRKLLSYLGSKGGKAGTGKAKARDPELMRAAARKRWAQVKKPLK